MMLFCGAANAGMGEFAISPRPDAAAIAPKSRREIRLFDDTLQFLSEFRTGGLGTPVQGQETILNQKNAFKSKLRQSPRISQETSLPYLLLEFKRGQPCLL